MPRRAAPIIVLVTVLLVQAVFLTMTFRAGEVKFFIFAAGQFVLLAVVAGEVMFGRRSPLRVFSGGLRRHVFIPLAAYFVLALAGIVWAHFRAAAAWRTLDIFLYVFWTLMVVMALRTRADIRAAVRLFLGAGVLCALMAIGASFIWDQQAEQFFLPMGGPNWLAACMLIPMMLCVEAALRSLRERPRRPLWALACALAFALMAYVVYRSGSESAAAAFVPAVMFLPVALRAKRRWLIACALVGLIALGCVVDVTMGRPGKLRSFAASKSVQIRLDMWRWSLKLVRRNPVSGLGAGGYLPNVGEVSAPDIDRNPGFYSDINQHAHNEPLEVLVELGVLGLAAFLWPIVWALIAVSRLPKDGPDAAVRAQVGAFAAGWLAVFLQSFLTVGMRFWSVPVVFWTGLGLLAAGVSVLRRPAEEEADPVGEPLPRGAINFWLAVLIVALLGGGYFIIVRGFRGSMAMKEAETAGAVGRVRLMKEATENSVFFVDRMRAHSVLGRVYLAGGKPRAAEEQFQTVLDLAGEFHVNRRHLAESLLAQGQLDAAMTHLERYAALRPVDPRTAHILLDALRALPPERAIGAINALFQKYPESSKVLIAAALVKLSLDPPDHAGAEGFLANAVKKNPADAHARLLLGHEMRVRGDAAAGAAMLESAWQHGSRTRALFKDLIELAQERGDERAAALWQRREKDWRQTIHAGAEPQEN